MRTVATFSTPAEAHMAATRLESAGIPVFIRDENTVTFDWLLSNAVGGVKIEVEEDDWADARRILTLPQSEKGILACPFCGSGDTRVRVLNAWGAVCMMLKLPFPQRRATVDCMNCRRTHRVRIDGKG
ncbi:hypothetical protein OpiT1DRAFT_01210 [Opitutaceae bacterium TAV1]|nr:hypothetical protein OpiT1DRAFT_01210 [Opitutaceae bacterium TAV1]